MHTLPPGGGGATTTLGRGLAGPGRRAGARGARDGAMGGQKGQTPDLGCPVLPSRRGTRGEWVAGGGGAAQPAPNP